MASSGGIWVPMAQRALRQALVTGTKFTKVLRNQIQAATRGELEPITVRSTPYGNAAGHPRQPVHPLAFRRQIKNSGNNYSRWYSSTHRAVRRFFSTDGPAVPRYVDRVAYLKSSVGSNAVWKASGRAPFASTLRPNLTGGALPRTAGGYASGGAGRGGARYFSHTPAAPAQVVQNVSQAMRAFWVSGKRARYNGTDAHGRTSYKAISALEEDMARKLAVPALPKMAPGAFVDFPLNPTITALAPLVGLPGVSVDAAPSSKAAVAPTTLGTEGFLDVLSVDFARALKELSAIMNDLKRLAALGDLPVLLDQDGSTATSVLRVRFPGVDAETVDRLCEDLGITRGLVGQDPGFDLAMGTYAALRFPFAPDTSESLGSSEAEDMLTSPGGSLRSHQSWLSSVSEDEDELRNVFDYYGAAEDGANPWLASFPASSVRDLDAEEGYASISPPVPSSGEHMSQEFEGLEGIYRFLEECDRVQGRL